jgi:AraC-like DNA-binding protein
MQAEDVSQSVLFEGNLPSKAAVAAVMAHPRFTESGRSAAAGLVALYQGERVINQVMPDRIRYIISVFALHLHSAGHPNDPNSGLTASRLCRLCAERKICSEGRAAAMLAIMRSYGHLVPAPGESDRRLRRLAPAEPLFAWHRKRCTFFFAAAARVMPENTDALTALDAPAFLPKFIRHLARTHAEGFHYVAYVPDVRMFFERNAGGPILMSIALAGASDDTFPPSRPMSLSLAAIARDFGVSRVHVRRVIQEGVSAGLLERTGARGEAISVSPRLRDAIRRVLAAYLIHYAHCARLAHAEIAEESAVA